MIRLLLIALLLDPTVTPSPAPTPTPTPAPREAAAEKIVRKCRSDWPADIAMQEHCARRLGTALGDAAGWLATHEPPPELESALGQCGVDWFDPATGVIDYAMMWHCWRRQIGAWERLVGPVPRKARKGATP